MTLLPVGIGSERTTAGDGNISGLTIKDTNNLATDNYQRSIQPSNAITSKYKRSNSLLAPALDSKQKGDKKSVLDVAETSAIVSGATIPSGA